MRHARIFTAGFLILSIAGYTGAQTVRCTTWNLEFPNGSAKETPAAQKEGRIKEAAEVLRPGCAETGFPASKRFAGLRLVRVFDSMAM